MDHPQLQQHISATAKQDPLAEAILFLAKRERIPATHSALVSGLPLVDGRLTPALFVRACERVRLEARVEARELAGIPALVFPVVLLLADNQALLLLESDGQEMKVQVPGDATVMMVSLADLLPLYSGYVILVKPIATFDERAGIAAYRYRSHWFWGTLSQSWKIYRDVLLASLLINLFVLANPLFVMNVYDRVVPNDALETLWALAMGVSLVYVFDLALKLLRTYFIEVAGKKSDILLSSYILERVLGARYHKHPASTGSFVAQLREFESLRNFITSATATALVDLPFVVLFLAVMAYIGGSVAWVPLLIIPVIIIYALVVQHFLQKSVAYSFAASAQKNATLVEGVNNLETIKALGTESRIQRAWEGSCGLLAKWGIRSRMLSASAGTVTAFLQQIASVLIVVVGVYAIAERELTMGALIACVILGGRVLAPLAQIVSLLVQYQQSVLALQSLNEIVNTEQERSLERNYICREKIQGNIEFRDLYFRYPSEEQQVLRGVSFKVAAGEHVAIIGRLGSGKSTLQKLILGLYQPQSGAVLLDGLDVLQIDPADLRRNIGYVAQDSTLFYGSLRDNVSWKDELLDDAELMRIADMCGITEFANNHPKGFDRLIRERGEGLSGGQKQSVNIARSLVGSPSLFLLDEPTTNMDNASEARILSSLAQEMKGKTLLLVTHKTSLLALVERVIVLDNGQIIADGPKDRVVEALKKGQLRVS